MRRLSLYFARLIPVFASMSLSSSPLNAANRVMPQSISITTFNIKYFGLNGDPNSTQQESRVATIRDHLERQHLLSDVIVFEEVVDVGMLATQVLANAYTCQSYANPSPQHQHVVVCVRGEYSFTKATDDDNFTLEDVSMNNDHYRPGVHGILKDRRGREVLHIIGVHLKAYPEMSDVRLQQIDFIANYLARRADIDPIVVLGDFNTYTDDAQVMTDHFDGVNDGLVEADVPGRYTFHSGSQMQKFDHMWTSRGLTVSNARVVGPCNSNDRAAIARYNAEVSDHCAVTLTLGPGSTNP